jgi:hypothetical protein
MEIAKKKVALASKAYPTKYKDISAKSRWKRNWILPKV